MKTLLVCCLILAAAAFLIIRSLSGGPAKAQPSLASAPLAPIGAGALGKKGFWQLIDHSAVFEADPDRQVADLRASLDHLTADQIAEFEEIFDETMKSSYSWDLWGAAYVANGGASDDGFEYFRCWLISKGRSVFEAVSADPDRLAELLAPNAGGDLEFEDFAYVARYAWAAKTGRDWNDMPRVANMAYDDEPSGKPFSEDPAKLAARYPKLWKRFGG